MRNYVLLLAGLVAAATIPHSRVQAQVTLDLHALDAGKPAAPPPKPSPSTPHKRSPHHGATAAKDKNRVAPDQPSAKPVPAALPAALPPALPMTPPSGVALPPIVVQPPPTKAEVPPAAPISASAGGAVEPISGGLRVLFSPERTDLTAQTEAGIRSYLDTVTRNPATTYNVLAYAAGPPQDPSTPRRLSLSRALAVRSVLMANGIPSEQIYLRALGRAPAGSPDDRVDLTALGTNTPQPHGGATEAPVAAGGTPPPAASAGDGK